MEPKTLSDRVEALGQVKGLNLKEIATGSGVPYAQLHSWKSRGTIPNGKSLLMVADFLQVTPHHLMYGTPTPQDISSSHSRLLEKLPLLSSENLDVLLATATAMSAQKSNKPQ